MSEFIYIKEPVEDNPLLEKFYANKKRWAWHMESYMELKRNKTLSNGLKKAKKEKKRVITDWAPPKVFARNLLISNEMEVFEFEMLEMLISQMIWIIPDVIFHIELPVDESKDRIKKRKRPYEQILARPENNYLANLNDQYGRYLSEMLHKSSIKVLANPTKNPETPIKIACEIIRKNDYKYIWVTGIIAAGKSTICEGIIERWKNLA